MTRSPSKVSAVGVPFEKRGKIMDENLDILKRFWTEDMVKGDCLFAATGVTDGSLLSGVKFRKHVIQTETVVMRSVTGTVRYIKADHRQFEKFHLD